MTPNIAIQCSISGALTARLSLKVEKPFAQPTSQNAVRQLLEKNSRP